jgi:lipopolysaccharide assembly protein A
MKISARPLLWILTAPIVVVVVLFAVSNLDSVTLHLFPLPYDLTVRLYLLTLITLFMGFVLGSIVTWVADRKRRRETRAQAKRLQELEHELTLAKLRAAEAERRLTEITATTFEATPVDVPVPPVLAE